MVSFQQGSCSLADVFNGKPVFAHQHRSGRAGAEFEIARTFHRGVRREIQIRRIEDLCLFRSEVP